MYNVNQISGCGTGGNTGKRLVCGIGFHGAMEPCTRNSKSLDGPSRIEQPLPGRKWACPSIQVKSGAAVFKLGLWRTPPSPSKRASRAILIRGNHV